MAAQATELEPAEWRHLRAPRGQSALEGDCQHSLLLHRNEDFSEQLSACQLWRSWCLSVGKWKHWSWAQNTLSLSDMAEAKMGSGGRNTSEEPVENKGKDRHVQPLADCYTQSSRGCWCQLDNNHRAGGLSRAKGCCSSREGYRNTQGLTGRQYVGAGYPLCNPFPCALSPVALQIK